MDYSTIAPEMLLSACLNGREESAWIEFVKRFQPLIAGVALRVARQWGESTPQLIDDLVQEIYAKLFANDCAVLRSFHSNHPDAIYGFLKVFSANLAHDQFKASHAEKRGGAAKFSAQDTEGLVTTQSHAAEIERKLILGQVSACLKTVASGPNANRDRQIFWLYYRVGLSASAIAAFPTFGLGVKGVESTILRLTRALRQKLAPEKRTIGAKKPFEGIHETESL